MCVDLREQAPLERLVLGHALLDDVGVPHRVGERRHERDRSSPPGGQRQLRPRPLGVVQHLAYALFGLRMRVVQHDVVPALHESSGPAAADDAASDDCDAHQGAVRWSFSRTSSVDEHAHVHRLEDRDRTGHEVGVGRLDAALEPDVVLEPDANVAADERSERDVRQLHPADGEGREHAVGRELVHEREQRPRVVGRAVGDAHAQLEQRGLVDEPLGQQLLREHEVARVEDLDLGAHAERSHLTRHLAKHRRRVRHHVVAFREVHRPAVERADVRPQLGDVRETLGRAGHVGSVRVRRQRRLDAAEHEIAAHPRAQVDDDVDRGRADALHDIAVEREVARRTSCLGIPNMDMDHSRPCSRGVEGGGRDRLGCHGNELGAIRRRAHPRDGTGDEDLRVH